MLRHAIKVICFAAAVAAIMMALRLLVVEPDEIATACLKNSAQWVCRLRNLAIQGFVHKIYSSVSLVAALFAWLTDFNLFAMLALAAGVAGVTLYDFEFAAPGLMFGALLWMRGDKSRAPVPQQAAAE